MPSPFFQQVRHRAIVAFRQQVGDRPPKIPQETVAYVGTADHAPRQDRQIPRRVVAAPLLELSDHVVRPVLHAGFPTIHHHIAQTLAEQRAEGLFKRIEVTVKIGLDVFAVQLVHFQPRARRRGGTVCGPGE